MGKTPIIFYATTIASLSIVVLYQLSRPPRTTEDTPPATGGSSNRLSAIIEVPAPAAGKVAQALDTVRQRNRRLQIQLESLEAATYGKGFVEVDREAFCRSNALNLRSVIDVDPASGSLPDALSLSDSEIEHLQSIFGDFHTRLKAMERDAVEILQIPAGRPTQLNIRVPANVEGKDAAFLQVESELHELLGTGRGGVAMAALQANDLIGTPNSVKTYSFTKTYDGHIEFTTAQEITRYFPGTDDGTPGVEPEVYSQRKLITAITMAAGEVKRLFDGLVDLSTLESQ
ncbi:MAG: hypothetical protein ACR2RV_16565 [Verrucomicrobiales bacterium]